MDRKNDFQTTNRTGTTGNIESKNYISGDSTPSSSSHQFTRLADDSKNDSKKSTKNTNS